MLLLAVIFGIAGCKDNPTGPKILDPDSAPVVSVDRFSDEAGTLFQRSSNSALPGPDEAIDFDQAPFITKGLGPVGQAVEYYNFDVMPTQPAPIFVLFREGENEPVENQLNIIDVLPGDENYNDFWHVHKVTVPAGYRANSVTSRAEIMEKGYAIEETDILVNCPVVPEGSTASKRYSTEESTGLIRGWYRDQVVYYFSFEEKALSPTGNGTIPTSPIYVSFNINPGEAGGGPASGFKTEQGNDQTHNVTATVPNDAEYSPLWFVNVYDNADFDMVSDLSSAQNAGILAEGAAIVNCPIVSEMP
ncbi:MAG: hypothetical protein R3224_11075 [Balneolaceae bacterium]|nr:hypothetical protein [Balneolaceae bacterium]